MNRGSPPVRPSAGPPDRPTARSPERALVIVPTYNERENLPRLVPQILAQHESLEILVVDDSSPDGTGVLAEELAETEPRLHVLHRAGKLGLGTAYLAGFRWGLEHGFDYLFEMDADFSHDPAHLPTFLAAIQEYDLIDIGYRLADLLGITFGLATGTAAVLIVPFLQFSPRRDLPRSALYRLRPRSR